MCSPASGAHSDTPFPGLLVGWGLGAELWPWIPRGGDGRPSGPPRDPPRHLSLTCLGAEGSGDGPWGTGGAQPPEAPCSLTCSEWWRWRSGGGPEVLGVSGAWASR